MAARRVRRGGEHIFSFIKHERTSSVYPFSPHLSDGLPLLSQTASRPEHHHRALGLCRQREAWRATMAGLQDSRFYEAKFPEVRRSGTIMPLRTGWRHACLPTDAPPCVPGALLLQVDDVVMVQVGRCRRSRVPPPIAAAAAGAGRRMGRGMRLLIVCRLLSSAGRRWQLAGHLLV